MSAPCPTTALPLEQSCHVPGDGIQRCPLTHARLNVRQHPAHHFVTVDLRFAGLIEPSVDIGQHPRILVRHPSQHDAIDHAEMLGCLVEGGYATVYGDVEVGVLLL